MKTKFLLTVLLGTVGFMPPLFAQDMQEIITCRYHFKNLIRRQDRDRTERIIKTAALGEIKKTGTDTDPVYQFQVQGLQAIEELHPRIMYQKSGTRSDAPPHKLFNANKATFDIEYSTIDLFATIEVIVRFRITPGARLFIKPEGMPERDITEQVNPDGQVSIQTQVRRGQEFINARTVSGSIEKFIGINIYSQQTRDIDKEEYYGQK